MRANSLLALSGALSVVAAVPFAGQPHYKHHHHPHRRELVWETVTEEVLQTIAVTKTIWLEPGETPPTAAAEKPAQYGAPKAPAYTPSSAPAAPAYSAPAPSSPAPAAYTPPAYTPPAASSPAAPPVYSAPSSSSPAAPAYTPPASSYVPPPAPVTPSSYVAPAPSSSYVAPAPPASSSSAPAPSAGGSGLTYGMAKAGTYYSGDLTWYEVGMGACGISSTPDQPVVAVAHSLFDSYNDNGNPNNNPVCGKQVTITNAAGKQFTATVVDRCTGCADEDLDLSHGFFTEVTGETDGRLHGQKWCFD